MQLSGSKISLRMVKKLNRANFQPKPRRGFRTLTVALAAVPILHGLEANDRALRLCPPLTRCRRQPPLRMSFLTARDELGAPAALQDALRWLTLRVQFPMPPRALVGRVEYGVVEEGIGHV